MGGDGGDADFDEVFRALYPRARSVAYRILGNRVAAEDAAAEALTRALTSWRRVNSLPYRDAWVLRVTTNVAIDMRRRQRPEVLPSDVVVDAQEATVLRVALAEALSALPRRQREVIALRYVADMTEQEIACCLRVSVGSVKRHGHRAVSGLRRRLGEDWLEGGARVAI